MMSSEEIKDLPLQEQLQLKREKVDMLEAENNELEKEIRKKNTELAEQGKKIEELEKIALQVELLKGGIASREEALAKLRERLQRMEIVIYSKLTRRQQKQFPKWVEAVDMSTELKLKETFAFPKIGVRFSSGTREEKNLRYSITGLADKSGLFTDEEATDVAEYLNSFPENQHQLKNMDSEFRDEAEEFALRAKLDAEGKK